MKSLEHELLGSFVKGKPDRWSCLWHPVSILVALSLNHTNLSRIYGSTGVKETSQLTDTLAMLAQNEASLGKLSMAGLVGGGVGFRSITCAPIISLGRIP